MAKFKVPASVPKVATDGAKPQPEPQQESPKTRERKPIHPGLRIDKRCLKCETFLNFHAVTPSGICSILAAPFAVVFVAFCECGIWTMDQRERIRWIRYSSGPVRPGEGEVYAP